MRISLVAWGDKHVRLAKEICLPSLLDPEIEVTLDVFTDRPNEFDFKTTFISAPEKKHKLVSDCHRQSIKTGEPVVIVCPDMVFAAGTLKALKNLIESGKRMIMVPGPRLDRGKTLPLIRSGMSNRELCAVALDNLHPGFDLMFWESEVFTDTPSQIYWRRTGLVGRCFHMHPLLIWGDKRFNFVGTVDDDCVDQFSPENTHVITDSDEIACFEMSPSGYRWQDTGLHKGIEKWVPRKTNRMHRWFFTHECHIHTGLKESINLPEELRPYA